VERQEIKWVPAGSEWNNRVGRERGRGWRNPRAGVNGGTQRGDADQTPPTAYVRPSFQRKGDETGNGKREIKGKATRERRKIKTATAKNQQ